MKKKQLKVKDSKKLMALYSTFIDKIVNSTIKTDRKISKA